MPKESKEPFKKTKLVNKKSNWVIVVKPTDPEPMIYSSDTEETPTVFSKIGKALVKVVKFLYLS